MPTTAGLSYGQLSDVPESLRNHAEEKDGNFTVSVVLSSDLKEFRDNNIQLNKDKDAMTATLTKYEQVTGVPLADVQEGALDEFSKSLEELRGTAKRVEDGKLVENTSLEEAAAKRVSEVTADFRGQIEALTKDRDAHKQARGDAERRMNEMLVENVIRAAAADPDVAMYENAVNLLLPQAQSVFKVDENGAITPKEQDGTTMYNSDGLNPMSPKEWLLKQREVNDFLYRGARGGGSLGSSDTTSGKRSWDSMKDLRPEQKINLARNGKA